MKNRFCYSKMNRLRKRYEFTELYDTGQKKRFHYYSVFTSFSSCNKLGISIPKRLGKAVFRNRQKRLLREYFRLHQQDIRPARSILFLLVRKPQDIERQTQELNRIFQWLTAQVQ